MLSLFSAHSIGFSGSRSPSPAAAAALCDLLPFVPSAPGFLWDARMGSIAWSGTSSLSPPPCWSSRWPLGALAPGARPLPAARSLASARLPAAIEACWWSCPPLRSAQLESPRRGDSLGPAPVLGGPQPLLLAPGGAFLFGCLARLPLLGLGSDGSTGILPGGWGFPFPPRLSYLFFSFFVLCSAFSAGHLLDYSLKLCYNKSMKLNRSKAL